MQEVAEASVGDPAPMGLFGFAVGTLLVAIPIAGIMPLTNVSAALPTLLTKLLTALREGTPNRNRIALQMVKDVLDESSFDTGLGHGIPASVGRAAAKVAGKLRDQANPEHPE
ncbi:MAG TPA: hypothetical protein VH373_21845 [Jatrophihabitantaceae bacterium]